MIGVGGIAAMHLANLLRMPEAEVVALADIDPTRIPDSLRRATARMSPPIEPPTIESFDDTGRMLAAVAPDAVFISLPPFAHGEVEYQCIEAGVPMLVQKPVGLDMPTVRGIERAIAERGLMTAVGYQTRYSQAADTARELLADRTVGMAIGAYLGGMPGTPWWRVQAQSGGQVVEQATHVVDLQRYLVGEIESIHTAAATRLMTDAPNLDIFDVSAATFQFANGAVGTLLNTCGLNGVPGEAWDHGVTIVARDLSMWVWTDGGRIARPGEVREVTNSTDSKYLLDEAFVRAVQTGDASGIRSTYADAVLTLQATLAIEESARAGAPVRPADLG
jgi:predicted dehydrogenase